MEKINFVIILLCSVLLCSCSTVFNTPTQEITINSNPPNAKLVIDGKKFGTTPQIVNIERGINHVIKFELPGYEPYEIQTTKKLSSWLWLNVFNGFLPGFIVDYLSGSHFYIFPESVNATLTPVPKKVETTE
ncbi:MAG: PEGA domain-containing protein [Bacteroidota bacterium]|nr:PEGA domain-containing protein [Bacteroidota bacterium]